MMIKVVSLLLYLCLAPFAGALLDGVDRKITARMQGRKGPKLLQPFYDLIKLFSKQMIAVNSVQLLLNLSYLAFLAIAGGILFFGSASISPPVHSAWKTSSPARPAPSGSCPACSSASS